MNRRPLKYTALLLAILGASFLWYNRTNLVIGYHRWAMNAEYNKLFGNPDASGGTDVTGLDVDAIIANYEYHRQRLVDFDCFFYLKVNYPRLRSASDLYTSLHGLLN